MRLINDIIVHCSATEGGRPFTADDIKAWHIERGFKTIGYHYVILLDGTIQRGRPISQAGAHCKGHNAHSIGICYIGGLKDGKAADTRTPAQISALRKLLYNLVTMYRCKIHGHRDYARRDCPCFDARDEYDWVYKHVVLGA